MNQSLLNHEPKLKECTKFKEFFSKEIHSAQAIIYMYLRYRTIKLR